MRKPTDGGGSYESSGKWRRSKKREQCHAENSFSFTNIKSHSYIESHPEQCHAENIFKYSQKPFLSEYLFYQFHTLFTTKKQKHMSFYVKKNVLVMAHPNFHPLPQPRVRAISKSRPLPPHVSWSYSPTPDMCNGFFPPEFIRGAPSLKRSQKKGIFFFLQKYFCISVPRSKSERADGQRRMVRPAPVVS